MEKQSASSWFWENIMRSAPVYPKGTFPEKIDAKFIQKPAKIGHSVFKKLSTPHTEEN